MNLLNNTTLVSSISWQEIVINLFLAFALGLIVSWIYRWTHRGFSYSVSFVHTLVLLSSITAFVMMVIGNSIARAFSLVGALSIIRFRTPVKDTRDTAFVFLSLGIGFATGTGSYIIAILGSAAICLFALITHRARIGESGRGDFLLRFCLSNSPDGENIYTSVFDKYLKKSTLVNITTLQQGAHLELAFSIAFREQRQQQQFLRELNAVPEVEQAMLIAVEEGEEC
jgi:uncharacterized membrane protein YhiD involved in acid resistance